MLMYTCQLISAHCARPVAPMGCPVKQQLELVSFMYSYIRSLTNEQIYSQPQNFVQMKRVLYSWR